MNVSLLMLAMLTDPAGPSPGFRTGDLIAYLLVSLLAMVLFLGALCVLLVLQVRQSKKSLALTKPSVARQPMSREQKAKPLLFDFPGRWLAVKSANPHSVQNALGLNNPTPCSWEQGLARSQDFKLFVSPPINGWILVAGLGLPDPSDDVDQVFHFILGLSRKVGHVQYFSVNRAVNSHAWVLADQARVRRAYAWAGTTLWTQGELTAAEKELAMTCFDYGEASPPHFPPHEMHRGNIDKVSLLAGLWSVDPTALDQSAHALGPGIAGELRAVRQK
jgi:hypothetical protein